MLLESRKMRLSIEVLVEVAVELHLRSVRTTFEFGQILAATALVRYGGPSPT